MISNLKKIISISFILCFSAVFAQTYTLKFKTNYGNFDVLLYDFTPNHRDLIIKEINKGTYTDALFNRVIKDFVIQGGGLDDEILENEKKNNIENPPRLKPEFNPRAFHKMGALGAGRDDNKDKASFFNQIYFVVGKQVSQEDLTALEIKNNLPFTLAQKEEYLKNGGLPRLDNNYTVFGEVTKGLKNVIKISKLPTNENDLPLKPVVFSIKIKENKSPKKYKTAISLGGSAVNFN